MLSFKLNSPHETCNNNQDALPYCLNTLVDILNLIYSSNKFNKAEEGLKTF